MTSARLMLGLSVFGSNWMDAKFTTMAFVKALRPRFRLVIGVETAAEKDEVPLDFRAVLAEIQAAGTPVRLWHKGCTREVLKNWPDDLPRPWYSNFSYGQAPNILRVLARRAGCEFLVRVDPGTLPFEEGADLVARELAVVNSGALTTSAAYSGRYALRTDFVLSTDSIEKYLNHFREYTGIDSLNGPIGGAGMVFSATTPPAFVSDGVRAAGTDDLLYRTMYPGRAEPLAGGRFYRATSGYAMPNAEYFRRLAATVLVRGAQKGQTAHHACVRAQEFLNKLADFARPELRETVEAIDVRRSLDAALVFAAVVNHKLLVDRWPEVADKIDEIYRSFDAELTSIPGLPGIS